MEDQRTGRVKTTMETLRCMIMMATGVGQAREVASTVLKTEDYVVVVMVGVIIPPVSIRILDLPFKGMMTMTICGE